MQITRSKAVADLIRFRRPLAELRRDLERFEWDCDHPLATLTAKDVCDGLRRYRQGQLSAQDLAEWADLVEHREDIEFEPAAADAVFRLANPEITEPVNDDLVEKLLLSLCAGNAS